MTDDQIAVKPDEVFVPNVVVEIRVLNDMITLDAEDYDLPYVVAEVEGRYLVISKHLKMPISSYKTLKVARNFARRFPVDFPYYEEVAERVMEFGAISGDREYLRAAEDRKRHVDFGYSPDDRYLL